MAMDLYTRDCNPDKIRDIPADSITASWCNAGWNVGADAAEASSTSTVINATGHAAAVGDEIIFTSGSLDGEFQTVSAITANTITVDTAFSGAPTATDTFNISRPGIVGTNNAGHGSAKEITVINDLNQDIELNLNSNNDNNHCYVGAGDSRVITLRANNLELPRDGHIRIRAVSTLPTTGTVRIEVSK